MTQVILAIDGGATKTDCTLRTCDGTILYHRKGLGSNYRTVGVYQVQEVLRTFLTEVMDVYPEMRVDIAVFALAGIDSEQEALKMRALVEEVCRSSQLKVGRLIVENDAESVMRGVTGDQSGILLIVGTGSIAYGQDKKGGIIRAGGWGHLAGDEGSGHWLGTEVVRAIFKMEDGRTTSTSLKEAVLDTLELTSVQELATWLFSEPYAVEEIAQLSKVVDACSRDGDGEAIRITEEAADELALLLGSVVRQCGVGNEECFVFVSGGAITNSPVLFQALEKRIQIEFPLCELKLLEKSPIEYILARGRMTWAK